MMLSPHEVLNYGEAFAKADQLAALTFPGTGWMVVTVICICLFIGAMGKSAHTKTGSPVVRY